MSDRILGTDQGEEELSTDQHSHVARTRRLDKSGPLYGCTAEEADSVCSSNNRCRCSAQMSAVPLVATWTVDFAGRGLTLRKGGRRLGAIAESEGQLASYVRAHLPRAFLAPEIVIAILDGRQPLDLSLKQLMYRSDLSVDWTLQGQQLGFER